MLLADATKTDCESAAFDSWQHAISEAFVPLEVRSTASERSDSFSGTLRSTSLGRLRLSEVSGQQVDVRRTLALITRADPGVIKVGVQLTGEGTLIQHDREAHLAPGDLAIYDTSRPYELHFAGEFSMFVLMFPRELLRIAPLDIRHASARRIRGGSGVGALVSPFLRDLHSTVATDAVAPTPVLENAVIDLLVAALHRGSPEAPVGPSPILLGAKSFIENNLQDSTLDTAKVASRHHVSVRHLQKMFEAEGHTVAGWIRSRRLEKCRRDLADPQLRDEGIGAISARHGLVNSSHFSKLFKDTYGISPRAFREQESESP